MGLKAQSKIGNLSLIPTPAFSSSSKLPPVRIFSTSNKQHNKLEHFSSFKIYSPIAFSNII